MGNLTPRLQYLEFETQSIVLHCQRYFMRQGMLWSMGKDSTALLWMVKKLFGSVPFPIFHIDTSYKIPAMIEFREKLARDWNLPLQVFENRSALIAGMAPTKGRLECCKNLKTLPLVELINREKLQTLLIGIRRDEEGSRSKERYFSKRKSSGEWNYSNQETEVFQLWPTEVETGFHLRVHPLLSWTEKDIWEYTALEDIPFSELYLSQKGQRYRSLGCAPCTKAMASQAASLREIISELQTTQTSERDGRAQDSETKYGLEKLRQAGYM